MEAYREEEKDAERSSLTRDDLYALTFDYRQWFSFGAFRNQPDNMRDVLPTGLRVSLARDVAFSTGGTIVSERDWLRRLAWEADANDGAGSGGAAMVAAVKLKVAASGSSVEHLIVRRTRNWGWELRGADYVFRALDDDGDIEQIWEDLTMNIVVQERPKWVDAHRGPYPYDFREIPDDEDCKTMLDW